MRDEAQEGTDELGRQEARAAAAGKRGGGMKEPDARKGAGRARRHNDGAGAFLPLHLLGAIALQVAEASGSTPRRSRAATPLVLSAVSGMSAAQLWGTGHRVPATASAAVATAIAALRLRRITR